MGRFIRRIERRYVRLRLRERARPANRLPFAEYRDDPSGFFREVLGIDYLWDKQDECAHLLLEPPYRVQAPAGNEVGKTFNAAAVVLWWFCTRTPALVITTAPTFKQVKDLLWKEIRGLARRAKKPLNLPFQPKDCRIERAADDFAVGVTATDDTSFQGRHGPNILFVIDEATGVDGEFFTAIETMFSPPGHAVLAIYNPTDTTKHIYREYKAANRRGMKSWHVVRMSAADHPNIQAELRGEDPPVPYAIRLASFERRLKQWCTLVSGEPRATDVQWPPPHATEYIERTGQQPRWYRPGPLAEARLFGRFPSQSTYAVWSDADWSVAIREGLKPLEIPKGVLPEIGVDVARFGDDDTAFHVRCGPCSLHHEQFNGQDTTVTEGTVKRLCREWAAWATKRCPRPVHEHEIPVKVDDTGLGGAVVDHLREAGYSVSGIDAATRPVDGGSDYYRRRDELWFEVARRAREGEIDLSRLDEDTRDRLQVEAMAPEYKVNSAGQLVVEPKDETKKELGHSPDAMDAVNLAYAAVDGLGGEDDVPTVGMRMRR